MNADSMLYTLFTAITVFGGVLRVLSIGTDEVIDVGAGFGSVILGVLGPEVHDIKKSIKESRDVR